MPYTRLFSIRIFVWKARGAIWPRGLAGPEQKAFLIDRLAVLAERRGEIERGLAAVHVVYAERRVGGVGRPRNDEGGR